MSSFCVDDLNQPLTRFRRGVSLICTLLFVVMVSAAASERPDSTAAPIDPKAMEASSPTPDSVFTYLSSQELEHEIYVFEPADHSADRPTPALVMYHGGGWKRGTPDQFYRYARIWNQLGITVLLPVYGLEATHGATPQNSLEDAFLSWQSIKDRADELRIDAYAIAAGGGSAGGHLAAALATVEPPVSVSGHQTPVALVLFNPVIDNSPAGYAADRIGDDWERFSPLHNIGSSHPPTLFLLGDQDVLIPVSTGQAYCDAVEETGSTCSLVVYPNAEHGWFNREGFVGTLIESTAFLAETFGVEALDFVETQSVDAFLLIDDGEGDYAPLAHDTPYEAPDEHEPRGSLFRYEGPVVEGATFGVRAYFDERARLDVFSKTMPDLVLRNARNNYHDAAEWGRDTLFVGQTLGFATPAVLTDKGLELFADVERRGLKTYASEAYAGFRLTYSDWSVGNQVIDATHHTFMQKGTDYVQHEIHFDDAVPGELVVGIAKHENAETRRGAVDGVHYLLTYGLQTDLGNALGLAVIYTASDVEVPEDELSELAILAADGDAPSVTYWATADWEMDPDFAADIDAFEAKVRRMAAQAARKWSD